MGGINEWRNASPGVALPTDLGALLRGERTVQSISRSHASTLTRLRNVLSAIGSTTVLVPPGDYYLEPPPSTPTGSWATIFGSTALVFADAITLRMAPGARFILGRGVLLRIDGPLDAPAEQIFSIETEELIQEDPPITRPIPVDERGRVIFIGNKVPELHPEWWGAKCITPDSSPDSTDAMEQCFRAARADRMDTRYHRPVLPIVLQGRYLVTRELQVDITQGPPWSADTPKTSAGIVLIGRRGPWSPEGTLSAAIVAGHGSPDSDAAWSRSTETVVDAHGVTSTVGVNAGRSLLRLREVVGSVIEGVLFDGGGLSSACVQVTGLNAYSNVFRHCGFRGALDTLVQLGHFESAAASPPAAIQTDRSTAAMPVVATSDLSGMLFDGCDFLPEITATRSSGVRAVVHAADNALPLSFVRCRFQGNAKAMILAYAGAFSLRQCTFDNREPPNHRDGQSAPWGGVDVFLANPVLPGQTVPPACFHAVDVTSTSWQFLDSARLPAMNDANVERGMVLLDGLRHGCIHSAPMTPTPPAIEWFEPGRTIPPAITDPDTDGKLGAPLTMIGCMFGVGVSPSTSGNRDRVVAGPGTTLVTAVGCRLYGRAATDLILERTMTDPPEDLAPMSTLFGVRYLIMDAA